MKLVTLAAGLAIAAVGANPVLSQPNQPAGSHDVMSITGTNGAIERGWANMELPPERIKQVQLKLQSLGFYDKTLPVDGVWSPEVGLAVSRFQDIAHLPMTGNPDPRTLAALGFAGAASPAPQSSAQAVPGDVLPASQSPSAPQATSPPSQNANVGSPATSVSGNAAKPQ